jgi:hypothetical protein
MVVTGFYKPHLCFAKGTDLQENAILDSVFGRAGYTVWIVLGELDLLVNNSPKI